MPLLRAATLVLALSLPLMGCAGYCATDHSAFDAPPDGWTVPHPPAAAGRPLY